MGLAWTDIWINFLTPTYKETTMIERYQKEEISNIWTDQFKFEKFLDVEVALLETLEEVGLITEKVSNKARKATVNPQRIAEIERETRHDVIAFCTSITEQMSVNEGKFFHFGVTSSDIIDTSLTLQIKASLDIILPRFEKLNIAIQKRAEQFQDQICMGRSHGIWAEPMSFGQKLLGHYAEFQRRFTDLKDFYQKELTGQFSGAVGNYTILTPEIEEKTLSKLGLNVESVSTQIIPRDRIAKLISIFSLYACAVERLCIEIRHLQHSDVSEVFEGFSKGQKGSSTMPHKKNPISAENLSGIARVLRSHMSMAMDNTLLWHERDISHSSAERMYLPDAFGLVLYSIDRLENTVTNLVVDHEMMEQKVSKTFKHLSSLVLHKLIEVSENTREDLYKIVQKASFEAKNRENFYNILKDSFTHQRELEVLDSLSSMSEIEIFGKHTSKVFNRTLK